ncbi:hypothetical protein KJ708_04105 [bacterium]|nr:hypothetical protein [bacterium]MBU1917541.1 hypothetical protein [bacterium]
MDFTLGGRFVYEKTEYTQIENKTEKKQPEKTTEKVVLDEAALKEAKAKLTELVHGGPRCDQAVNIPGLSVMCAE